MDKLCKAFVKSLTATSETTFQTHQENCQHAFLNVRQSSKQIEFIFNEPTPGAAFLPSVFPTWCLLDGGEGKKRARMTVLGENAWVGRILTGFAMSVYLDQYSENHWGHIQIVWNSTPQDINSRIARSFLSWLGVVPSCCNFASHLFRFTFSDPDIPGFGHSFHRPLNGSTYDSHSWTIWGLRAVS